MRRRRGKTQDCVDTIGNSCAFASHEAPQCSPVLAFRPGLDGTWWSEPYEEDDRAPESVVRRGGALRGPTPCRAA